MPDLQGLASFPGITVITGANMTHSHGISPSVALITTVPHTNFIPQVGELAFTFGDVKIKFPDCMVDTASLRISQAGQIWTMRVLDRRWKWKFGEICGRYNVRHDDETIEEGTERTPQQLAKLLLSAMGERVANISALPNKARPEVVWDSVNPAEELASLCDSLSCRVVLDLDNRVYLRRIGIGSQLPSGGVEMNIGYGFKRENRPDFISITGGKTLYQSKLLLEAVGEETDGSIKPIDELSYKPSGGWQTTGPPDFYAIPDSETYLEDGVSKLSRELAIKTVYKMYRVRSFWDGTTTLPGFTDDLKTMENITLHSERLEKVTGGGPGEKKARQATVSGIFFALTDGAANTSEETSFKGSFSIDEQRRIVVFSEAVYKVFALSTAGQTYAPASLLLETSYNVRFKKTEVSERFFYERKLPGKPNDTGPKIVSHPEIINTFRSTYDDGIRTGHVTNTSEVNKEAEFYWTAEAKKFDLEPSQDVQYAGLVAIRLDGAVQQVSWQVGGGPAFTRASRNEEYDVHLLSYDRKREVEKQEAALAKEEKKRASE